MNVEVTRFSSAFSLLNGFIFPVIPSEHVDIVLFLALKERRSDIVDSLSSTNLTGDSMWSSEVEAAAGEAMPIRWRL